MSKFRPQRKNLNKHTDAGTRELDASVKRDGWIGAITVAADGKSFDGLKSEIEKANQQAQQTAR